MKRPGQRAAKGLLGALGRLAMLFAGVTALYFLSAWIGSSIPAASPDGVAEAGGGEVEILIETNGLHTGIIVPIVTAEQDWRTVFPGAAGLRGDTAWPTHFSIGWGERVIFLDTPYWSDLSPLTALRIATVGGDAVMRVTPYVQPRPGPGHRPVRLSSAQYRALARAIEASLPPPSREAPRQMLVTANPHDAFYAATGHYSLLVTCNSWTGTVLAEAGVPMGAWTPMAGGVVKWIDPPPKTPRPVP